jgi:hypothetical protein
VRWRSSLGDKLAQHSMGLDNEFELVLLDE